MTFKKIVLGSWIVIITAAAIGSVAAMWENTFVNQQDTKPKPKKGDDGR